MADLTILFGSGIFIFIGLLIIWFAFHLYNKRKRMEKWTKTIAIVKDSKISSSISTDSHNNRSTLYTPIVSYSYEFNGKKYETKNSDFGSSNRSEVENLLGKYEKGTKIEILVDPIQPDKSGIFELSTQPNTIIYILIGFGVVFCVMGLLVYLIFGSDDVFSPSSMSVSSKTSSFDAVLNLLGPLFAFSVGGIFVYIGYYLLKKDQTIIKSWQMVEAEVLSSSMLTKTESRKNDRGLFYDQTTYCPSIRYSYSYNNRKYSGEDSSYYSSSQSEIELALSKVSEGSKISIYVNPNNPSESSMKDANNSKNMFAYVFIAVGILAMLIGMLIFIFSFF